MSKVTSIHDRACCLSFWEGYIPVRPGPLSPSSILPRLAPVATSPNSTHDRLEVKLPFGIAVEDVSEKKRSQGQS
jgi:hypothetical protein